jgi:hypothetical protein
VMDLPISVQHGKDYRLAVDEGLPLAMARWNPAQWLCRKSSGTITSKVFPATED